MFVAYFFVCLNMKNSVAWQRYVSHSFSVFDVLYRAGRRWSMVRKFGLFFINEEGALKIDLSREMVTVTISDFKA